MIRDVTSEAILIGLYDYWHARRRAGEIPDRADIDPLEIPRHILPYLMLVELVDGPSKARYRLIGTAIVERVGVDQTGMFVHETIFGEYLDYIVDLQREACRHRTAVYAESIFRWNMGRSVISRRVLLPLTHGTWEPRMMLVGTAFEHSPGIPPTKAILSDAVHHIGARHILAETP